MIGSTDEDGTGLVGKGDEVGNALRSENPDIFSGSEAVWKRSAGTFVKGEAD